MSESEASRRRMGGRPLLILSEDAERTSGQDAQESNISAAKVISESVRTTLGPSGMDKMLVSDSGDVTITNDGATILAEMDIEHPAAQMLVEVAESQEDTIGDGTTTATILAGQLLTEAEELFEDEIHPTTVVEGYREARNIALEAIDDTTIDDDLDDTMLHAVAQTSMTGKGTGGIQTENLADLVVEAVNHVRHEDVVERDDVAVVAHAGKSTTATKVIHGFSSDDEPVRDGMPNRVEDATVAVIDRDLAQRESERDVEYNITNTGQLDQAVAAEQDELSGYTEALTDAGIDVVFCTGDIADSVATQLEAAGVLAFENLSSDDVTTLLRTTGAIRIADLDDIEETELGHAETVRLDTIVGERLLFVDGGAEAEVATVFVRGGTGHVLDELERAVKDALDVVVAAIDDNAVVPGAGATEMQVADALREAAAGVSGREQYAVEAFADAVEALPRTLAENAGLDPIDALVELRAANEDGLAGIVVTGSDGEISDPVKMGVLDPVAVKREAVESGTEAATMIARIDDVISAD